MTREEKILIVLKGLINHHLKPLRPNDIFKKYGIESSDESEAHLLMSHLAKLDLVSKYTNPKYPAASPIYTANENSKIFVEDKHSIETWGIKKQGHSFETYLLNEISNNKVISPNKDTNADIKKALDKLYKFGLIEYTPKNMAKLSKDGYIAIESGGFEQYRQQLHNSSEPLITNAVFISGDNNAVNQFHVDSTFNSQIIQKSKSTTTKRSWLEILSWIAGIIISIIGIYEFIIK